MKLYHIFLIFSSLTFSMCSMGQKTGDGYRAVLLSEARKNSYTKKKGNTPLHRAKSAQDVEQYLQPDDNPNVLNNLLQTPAHTITEESALRLLLKRGASANEIDFRGRTPLHQAVRDKSLLRVRTLVAHEANVTIKTYNDRSAVDIAENEDIILALIQKLTDAEILVAVKGYNGGSFEEVKKALCSKYQLKANVMILHTEKDITKLEIYILAGMRVDQQDWDENQPLHKAPSLEAVELFLKYGADMRAKNKTGQSPLHTIDDIKTLEKFINVWEGFLDEADQDGYTPLWKSVIDNNFDKVKLILEYSKAKSIVLSVNKHDNKGLFLLNHVKSADMMSLLFDYGFDPKRKNRFLDVGNTILHRASTVAIVDLLVKNLDEAKRVPVDIANDLGQTPLHVQCANEPPNLPVIEALLKNHASVYIQDNDGNTPMHCGAHSLDVVRLLVTEDACVDIANNNGDIPLHCALLPSVIDFFVTEKKLNINILNDAKETPLMRWARILKEKQQEIIKITQEPITDEEKVERTRDLENEKVEILQAGDHLMKLVNVDLKDQDIRKMVRQLVSVELQSFTAQISPLSTVEEHKFANDEQAPDNIESKKRRSWGEKFLSQAQNIITPAIRASASPQTASQAILQKPQEISPLTSPQISPIVPRALPSRSEKRDKEIEAVTLTLVKKKGRSAERRKSRDK